MIQTLKAVVKDIKTFICQKASVIIVLTISLAITSYAFCFFIANSMHIAKIINDFKNPTTKYYVINKGKSIGKDELLSLKNWLMENGMENSVLNVYSDISKSDEISDSRYKNSYNIIIGSNNNKSKRVSFIGNTISELDINNKSNYVMIEYLNKEAHNNPFIIDKNINIRGENYIVKAIDRIDISSAIVKNCNINNYNNIEILSSYVIPITTFVDNYPIYSLDVKVPNIISKEKKYELQKFLTSNFKNAIVQAPTKIEDVNINDVSENIVIFTLLILLALINIIALFTYWIDKNWRKYMIYRICGASSTRIYFIVVIEALIIALCSQITGTILYYITTPILEKINMSYILKFTDVLIIQGIIIAVILINVTFNAIKISKVNPRYLERR